MAKNLEEELSLQGSNHEESGDKEISKSTGSLAALGRGQGSVPREQGWSEQPWAGEEPPPERLPGTQSPVLRN